MRTAEIKRRFLAHFEANGHTVVPSAPLPAIEDPNLLFINAGMVQFVPYFLGQRTPPYKRAASVQKCIRTPDIDEVGKTSRHGTFFQMNGNFSFGDYFKERAIPLAWDLSTKSVAHGGDGLDPEKIWGTLYLDDDEAIDLWRQTGVPMDRVGRRGKQDNFWSMGIPRPAGACSVLYLDRGPDDVRLRVIADHVRTSLMLIADGVTPSNEGRGYVLRRIIRRAIRSMRLLGWNGPALPELLPVARDCMAPSYPEVTLEYGRISQYAYGEEEAFLATLRQGTTILDLAIAETTKSGGTLLTGDKAFQLHDTYGFPIDLTLEIAAEQGLDVDTEGFRRLMTEQRTRAKADAQARKTGHADLSGYRAAFDDGGKVDFTGYHEVSRETRVRTLLDRDGAPISGAAEGDEVEVVLDATPFYAEGGGQQPDLGVLKVGDGEVEVLDVQQVIPGLIVHRGRVLRGEIAAGRDAYAQIDVARRRAISRAHTATHLVHQTMRNFLGESATQAGSLNAPGRLRFDFNTPGAVPPSVLHDVEQQVNEVLMSDLEVHAFLTTQEEARRIGAMALFGEKYGDEVRVVEVGDYARELCGGTHAARSGQLGLVKILHESSIGSGVRRVEALVGMDAFGFLAREHLLVSRLAELYRVPNDQVADRVEQTVAALRDAEKELDKLGAQMVLGNAGGLANAARDVSGVAYVGTEAPEGTGANDVRTLAQEIRGKIAADRPAVVAVASRAGGKASLVVAVNAAARGGGLSATDLVKGALSGRGGGNADLAQGGGVPADAAPSLLATVEKLLAP